MHTKKLMVIGLLVLGCSLGAAQAAEFLQLSLAPDTQLVPKEESISGIRLSIYGENQDMAGFELGIVNVTRGNFKGFSWNIASMVDGDAKGVMWDSFGYGRVSGDFVGWHSATFYSNLQGDSVGLQSSLVARNEGDFSGWQAGLIYGETLGQFKGLQTGLVNNLKTASGLQLGLVNMAENLYGVQIGLANYIGNGWVKIFPFVNAKF